MYPLDQGMWGPTVRITHLRDELGAMVNLDVVAGYRGPRRASLVRYAFSGRLRGLDGIYVESSSFLASETDLAFLALARGLRIPVLTYIRDAYQLFPDEYAVDTPRRWLGAKAFLPMLRALRSVSSRLAFPTAGLADAVGVADAAVMLPPGAPAPVNVGRAPSANRLLFVGDARRAVHGVDRLIAAVGLVRQRGVDVELTVVCRPGQEPPGTHPAWLRVERAEGEAIHALLPEVVATVIPRPRTAYNDLALPIKLMEYLSYGRPLIVTDCTEQARVVRDADAGAVTTDAIESIADGIAHVVTASAAERDAWSRNAEAAARSAAWRNRAQVILAQLVPG
jgi:hypothetical protein